MDFIAQYAPSLTDELVSNGNTTYRDSTDENETVNTRNPISYINDLGNFLYDYAYEIRGNKKKDGQKITDQDFQAVVQELRNRGYVTHAGAKQIFTKETMSDNLSGRNGETSTDVEIPKSDNFFDNRENFLARTARMAEEGPSRAFFRRGSDSQRKLLRQMSRMSWDNMSGRWNDDELLLEEGEEGDMRSRLLNITEILNNSLLSIDDNDENRSLNIKDILNDSILSIGDNESNVRSSTLTFTLPTGDKEINDIKDEVKNNLNDGCTESLDFNESLDLDSVTKSENYYPMNSLLVSFRKDYNNGLNKSLLVSFSEGNEGLDTIDNYDDGCFALLVNKQEEGVKTGFPRKKRFLAIFEEESENTISSYNAEENITAKIDNSSDTDLRSAFTVKLSSKKKLKCVKVKEVI